MVLSLKFELFVYYRCVSQALLRGLMLETAKFDNNHPDNEAFFFSVFLCCEVS